MTQEEKDIARATEIMRVKRIFWNNGLRCERCVHATSPDGPQVTCAITERKMALSQICGVFLDRKALTP